MTSVRVGDHLPPALRRFLSVGAGAFFLSLVLSSVSDEVLQRVDLTLAVVLLLVVIALGVLFDMLGVAASASREAPLHAMAADRVPGAAEAISLVRNAAKVSSFSQDVVGDVAGTLSGAIATTIVYGVAQQYPELARLPLTPLLVALVAALTIGGKAAEKEFALRRWERILLLAGRLIRFSRRLTGWSRGSQRVASSSRRNGRKKRVTRQSRQGRK